MAEDIFKLKFNRLIYISNLIHKYFPYCKTIGCFCDVKDIETRSDDELNELSKNSYIVMIN